MTEATALVFSDLRTFELRTLQVPSEPPPGGAIIRVLANGICGTDYEIYSGAYTPPAGRFATVLGHEIVGEIVAIDPVASKRWEVGVGSRVAVEPLARCGECLPCRLGRSRCRSSFSYSSSPVDLEHGLWGGMAQYMVLRPGSSTFPIPASMPTDVASMFNVFGNAVEWVRRLGDVQLGTRVAILGAGQRGLACAAVARHSGASVVAITGLTRDADKLQLALELGATHAFDVEGKDVVSTVATACADFDVVIDTTPHATASIGHAIQLLRIEGTLVVAGLKGRPVQDLLTDVLIEKSLTIRAAMGSKPASTLAALDFLHRVDLPFGAMCTASVPLRGVEDALLVMGGEAPGKAEIHIAVDPWL
jgi:threonine dehydrogenase-like Zn-dependent dehydrogenase